MRSSRIMCLAGLAPIAAITATAWAGGHTWRVNEVFGNNDGTIMFIELKECCGSPNEIGTSGAQVTSADLGLIETLGSLGCTNCTANKHILLATQAFADLPGAPAPDYIISPNAFDRTGDGVTYSFYHTLNFGPVPSDGVNSFHWNGDVPATVSIAANSPTNFAGDTASIAVRCHVADTDFSGGVDVSDLLNLLADWGPCGGCATDLDGNGSVDVSDLLALLAGWGPCP